MKVWNQPRTLSPRRKKDRRPSVPSLLTGVILTGLIGASLTSGSVSPNHIWAMAPGSGCDIKGNVSQNTGERIYHVRGQRYYRETVISPRYGERWFCSEAEARQAGWRKSRI